jgi:hypothetical protein
MPDHSDAQRRKIMAMVALQGQVLTSESAERKPWNSQDWRGVFLFAAQFFGIVCGGVFLYALGPGLGTAFIVGSLVVWSLVKNDSTSVKEESVTDEGYGQTAAVNLPARFASSVLLRNLGLPAASATRPVVRQGA